jgi:hypothetical protein
VERISSIDITAEKVDEILRNGYEWSLQASSEREAFSTLLYLRRSMKTYRIQLTAEEQKKLEQVLKRLKQRDVQSYFLSVLQEQWLKLG